MTENDEAKILQTTNILLVLSKLEDSSLVESFCGSVHCLSEQREQPVQLPELAKKSVYLCGDISRLEDQKLNAAKRVSVIKQLSCNYNLSDDREAQSRADWEVVDLGRVPILVHDVGVYYRRFFDPRRSYFERIHSEHVFQSLTESNKPGTAHRTGIYLTRVEKSGEELHFRLLRCSTNLSGPTETFRATDIQIVDALNLEAENVFLGHAPLNHALAQIYRNVPASETKKQTKAKIKSHADKTKDMPVNGIMAFCTFYDQLDKLQPSAEDSFDFVHKRTSGLTSLHFRLKAPVAERPGCTLPEHFSITLYPNSVFMIPLSTNRWYTHEIRPSQLDAELLPTRLGYVVRCSSTESVHREGVTFLKQQGRLVKMEPPTPEGMSELRGLYAEENKSDCFIEYGDRFRFSMNSGDYSAPGYNMVDEFRKYRMSTGENLFKELSASVRFETLGKGRQGTVLVRPDQKRGVPIVRTTSQYDASAQSFEAIHVRLAKQIQQLASLPQDLNNALVEVYTNAYTKMGFHSDQALDLQAGSCIALFSCYQHPEELSSMRKLVVESKEADGGSFEILLEHNSVVVFSVDTNRRFKHKIVLAAPNPRQNNQWLGITLRESGTFVRMDEGQVCFEDGTPLTLADESQRREFYSLRGRENKEVDFTYPHVTFTISKSDLLPPNS